jgi:hypothetical protein
MDPNNMDSGRSGKKDCSANGLKKIEFLANLLGPFGIEKRDRNDYKFRRHPDPQEMEENFKRWPSRRLHQAPCPGRQNQSVPSSHGQSTDHEILVSTEMVGQIKRRGKSRIQM